MLRLASVWLVSCCLSTGLAFAQAGTTPPAPPANNEACESDSDCDEGERCGEESVCVAQSGGEGTPPVMPEGIRVGQMQGATQAPELSESQIRWLKPRRHLMGQVPRAQTDFTAYALEFGEVRVGLANITAGVAPRVQVATMPLLWAVEVQNVQAKANPFRLGGLDLALDVSYFGIPLPGDFEASFKGIGGAASLQVLEKLSLHGGVNKGQLTFAGQPGDLVEYTGVLVSRYAGEEAGQSLKDWEEQLGDSSTNEVLEDGSIDINGNFVVVRFAADYRFNRRDSLVLQFQAMVQGSAEGTVEIPPILGLEEAFVVSEDAQVSGGDAFLTSLSWHSAWKRWEFRIGAGLASQPGAWVVQAMDVSYRFGGETRTSERRGRSTWRQNRGDQGKGDQEEPESP